MYLLPFLALGDLLLALVMAASLLVALDETCFLDGSLLLIHPIDGCLDVEHAIQIKPTKL